MFAIESLLDGLKRYLLAELPEYVSHLSAETHDGISLPMFREPSVEMYDKSMVKDFPCLKLVVDRHEAKRLSANPPRYEWTHIVSLVVTVAGNNDERLHRQLYRYLQAISACVLQDQSLAGLVSDTILTHANYEPTMMRNGLLHKTGWLGVRLVTKDEVTTWPH